MSTAILDLGADAGARVYYVSHDPPVVLYQGAGLRKDSWLRRRVARY